MYCDWPLLGRCCFCMPLRRGVLTFGYINIFVCAFLVGVYSYSVHYSTGAGFIYANTSTIPTELTVAAYCLEVVFNAILIYGAHKTSLPFVKAYLYYAITTTVASLLLQILDFTTYAHFGMIIEMAIFNFTALCIQLYLIMLVSSLVKKLEMAGPHLYDNPLHQIVTGEVKAESNGIYNNTTVVPVDT